VIVPKGTAHPSRFEQIELSSLTTNLGTTMLQATLPLLISLGLWLSAMAIALLVGDQP